MHTPHEYLPMQDPTSTSRIGHPNTLVRQRPKFIRWVWEGVVAEGAVTLLSAPEKVGKTTLLSLLLDRRRAGGRLLGRTVYPGRTVVCSEENDDLWDLRQPPLDFGPNLTFLCPGLEYPTRGEWRRFIDDVFALWEAPDPFDLLVIDTAMSFVPLHHRNKRVLRWALGQLRLVAESPAAVLIINQSRNMHRPLAAFADILIEMEIPRGLGRTRRRTFTGVGRYPDTLETAGAELNSEGTDYLLLPDSPAPQPPLLAILQTLLSESPTPLIRHELLARWQGEAPPEITLWRTLTRGVKCGLFNVTGSGTKTDAFRYTVAGVAKTNQPMDGTEQAPIPGPC
jgi:hypothetical protein